MREGGKNKHLRKKNIETIFEKVNEGDNFFFGNRQQSNARAGQKKTHVCFLVMRCPLMRALI